MRTGLLVCLAIALLACAPPPDEVIRLGIASAPANLDPRFATDATSVRINRLLYRRLVDFDAQIRPVASLASWQVLAPDHYRFSLAPDRAVFHDGQPVTAADVAATYRFILDPDNASPHRSALALIRRIEVLDDTTLDFFLKRPDPLFPGYLVTGIVPASAIRDKHPLHERPLGSGPFRFQDWSEPGRLRLERVADGQLVELLRIGDPTVRVLKLLRAEVDLLQNDLPAELLGYLDRQDGITVTHGPGDNFAYIGFNLEDPVTRDGRIRWAIAHAIDRVAIIKHVLGSAAKPATALLTPDHWAGNPELEPIPYAPQQSRRLLAASGYSDQNPLILEYKTSTDPVRLRIATIIQQHLAEVGIQVKLLSYDWGTFYGDIKAGRFQLYSLAWVGIKTPDIFRYAFHSESLPPQGANRGRLADPQTDRLLEAAERAVTLDAQAASYRALQAHLLEVLPYVPLWYEDHVVASRDAIAGYHLARDGNFDGLRHVRHAHY